MKKMSKPSIVYHNIHIYRLVMSLLYGMKYKKRFDNIIGLIDDYDRNIVELCFGDIFIADFAKKSGRNWVGFDINAKFVSYAKNNGYNAINKNILDCEIPENDVCIMLGSLYHFIDQLDLVIEKMLSHSKKVIISEPIINLSNNKYIGFLAKKSANTDNGEHTFRFTEQTLLDTFDILQEQLSFKYSVIKKDRDILLLLKNQ